MSFFQKLLSALEIFRGIDSHGLNVCGSHLDLVSVLQPAQLFQTFCNFERALWQLGYLSEHFLAIGVDAQMLEVREMLEPLLALLATYVWDDAAGEVESEALVADCDFRTVWILYSLHRSESLAQGRNLGSRVIEAMADGFQLAFCHERFIALYVDDDIPVAAYLLDGFPLYGRFRSCGQYGS